MKRLLALALTIAAVSACQKAENGKITASGTIEAVEVTVNAKMGGTIIKLRVKEGDHVSKGDALAEVDREGLNIQLKQSQANVAAANAQHELARRGARQEDIAQAAANLRFAEAEAGRAEDLYKKGSATKRHYDEVVMRLEVAKKAHEKLVAGLLPEEIDAARARLRLAQAQVEQVRKFIADSYISAPVEGVISQKSVEEGDDVLPNAQMFKISRLGAVHLMIYVSEIELARVKLGQKVKVFIDAYPERPFTGTITWISPAAEFTPKNVQTKDDRTRLVFGVKVEIPNPDQTLKPGMPADAEVLAEGPAL